MKRIFFFISFFLFLVIPGQGQVFNGHGESRVNLDQAFQKAVRDVEMQSGVEIRTSSRSIFDGISYTYSEMTHIYSNHYVRILKKEGSKNDGVYYIDIKAVVKELPVPSCPIVAYPMIGWRAPEERGYAIKSNGESVYVKIFWITKEGKCGPIRLQGGNAYYGYKVDAYDNTSYPDFYFTPDEVDVPSPGTYSLVFVSTPSRTCILGCGIDTVDKLEDWFWSLPSTEMRRPCIIENIHLG